MSANSHKRNFAAYFSIVGLGLRITLGNVGTKWLITKEGLRAMAIERVWIEVSVVIVIGTISGLI